MNEKRKCSRGQYFSFDAIIASVIMVIAITSLLAYWHGAQSVVDTRTGGLYEDSMRIADSLMSPGSPSNWASIDIAIVRQIGLSDNFSVSLNKSKVDKLKQLVTDYSINSPPSPNSNYFKVGRLLRSPANYYIVIDKTEPGNPAIAYAIGFRYPDNATQVAVAHRGAVIDGKPARVRVFLWRQ